MSRGHGLARQWGMTPAADLFRAAPELIQSWTGTAQAVAASLEPSLVHLVETRASQINGCANCINLHTKAARAAGEGETRSFLLAAWREAPVFTPRDRAALRWTDALTRRSEGATLEEARTGLEAPFTLPGQLKLTLMVNVIN